MGEENYNQEKEFLKVASAAYLWVSSADGDPKTSEIDGFVNYLLELPYIDEINDSDYEDFFLSLLGEFISNAKYAEQLAKKILTDYSGAESKRVDVLKISRKAVVADQEISDPEEIILGEIAQLLNLDENIV